MQKDSPGQIPPLPSSLSGLHGNAGRDAEVGQIKQFVFCLKAMVISYLECLIPIYYCNPFIFHVCFMQHLGELEGGVRIPRARSAA